MRFPTERPSLVLGINLASGVASFHRTDRRTAGHNQAAQEQIANLPELSSGSGSSVLEVQDGYLEHEP